MNPPFENLRVTGLKYMLLPLLLAIDTCVVPPSAWPIELQPTADQIAAALERGQAAAAARTPPDRLYTWFGPDREQTEPHGFLMTKLDGLAVMSAHFGLRGLRPSNLETDQILADPYLLVTVILFGGRPDFAVDTYALLLQGERKVLPVKVRFDGKADRSHLWPGSPAYRAKVVAFFAYADFDPRAKARLSIFPRNGGEESFDLDLGVIP